MWEQLQAGRDWAAQLPTACASQHAVTALAYCSGRHAARRPAHIIGCRLRTVTLAPRAAASRQAGRRPLSRCASGSQQAAAG